MLIINDATIDAIAPQISLPDSSSAYVVGFTVKTTWQAATCEWTTTSKEYYRYLTTSAEFGISAKKNGAGM